MTRTVRQPTGAAAGTRRGERRTQEERSAAMRGRLLDATVDCLVKYGYAATTTTRVAQRAGVTRGALVHHFQSKSELLGESVRHLAFKQGQEILSELIALDRESDADFVSRCLEALWRMHQGSMFIATMELWIAARTDPELSAQMDQFEFIVMQQFSTLGQSVSRTDAELRLIRNITLTAMDAVRGILVNSMTAPQEIRDQRWARAKSMLLTIVESASADAPLDSALRTIQPGQFTLTD